MLFFVTAACCSSPSPTFCVLCVHFSLYAPPCGGCIPFVTILPEINSNDFGPFWNELVEFESNFVVVGMNNFERFEFLVCLGFLCCVLWLVFTRGQTHCTETAQYRYTA